MALEVGRLVARIDIEGSFEAKIAAAKTAMEDAAKSAAKFDDAMNRAAQAGAKVKVSDEPKRKIDDAAKSAQKLDDSLSKAGESGKRLDVSSTAEGKIVKLESTARDYGLSLKAASDAGRNLDVSTAAEAKIVKLESTTRDYGLSLKKAADEGRNLDVSDKASSKIVRLESTTRDYGLALGKASDAGRSLTVSDQPRQKLAETASMAEQVNTKFSGLGITMKQVVGMAGGAAGLGAVLTKGWDRVTAIDTAQGKLRGLGHEAEGVATIMDSALESVKGTSYGLGDAATIAANAVAAGIQPGKDLTKYLTMTADASAIAGVSLGEMGRILNQVQTGQAAYAGDLSQLADRGIPIYQWLADEAGVAASEVKKMASTGQISSEMLFSAIQNNIGGAAKEVGSTLTGALANAGAAFGRLGAAAITPFKETILDAASGVTDFADTLSSGLGPVASVAATALSGVAKAVGVIPGPVLAATGALVALQKSGLNDALALRAMYAGDAVKAFSGRLRESIGAIGANAAANGKLAAAWDVAKQAGNGFKGAVGGVVNALGGPLMIGLAGAAVAVGDFIAEAQSAKAVNEAFAAATAESAAAQYDLAEALAASNGAFNENASAAAQRMVQAELDFTTAAAEQSINMFSDINSAIGRLHLGYSDWVAEMENAGNTIDRNAYRHEVAKLEMQALGDATAEAGIAMDDVNRVVAEGGHEYDRLIQSLYNTGDAGAAVAARMEGVRSEIRATQDAIAEAEDGSYQLAESFRILGDEASTVEDRTNAMKDALDALAGKQMTADEAAGKHHETMRKVQEAYANLGAEGENLTKTLENGKLGFDTTTEAGFNAWQQMIKLRDSHTAAVNSGRDLNVVQAETDAAMQAAADSIGVTVEQLWEMVESIGFVPSKIDMMVELTGAGEVLADIGRVATELEGVPPGKEITVKAASQEAIDYLRSVGWEVDHIPGEKNMRITASTEQARAGLAEAAAAANRLDNIAPNVHVETNAEWVTHALGITAAATEGLPDGHIEITDTTDANLERLANLGIEVSKDKHGRVIINDADVARARGEVQTLNSIVTTSQHRVNVTYSNPNFRGAGGSSGYADGGFHRGQVKSFANGGHRLGDVAGFLPDQAMIAAPQGPGGLVQWAEAETGGEAFIPLAPSKRQRSRKIWAKTGELLGINLGNLGEIASFADGGMLPQGDGKVGDMGGILVPLFGKFADGGITASGLVNFAKGVEGAPYVWGGVNWGDCSGAVSAIANYVSGRSPFGSRFATGNEGQALAERGFVPGRGSAGDLQIGWFNGGPYGGHTSATLPNGVNFEMGGGRGNGQYGGSAAGANHSQYTNHAHWPKERFADAAADSLGGAAVDNRTPREKNIDAIVSEGQRRGLSDRDIQIALMTAEQESGIRVLNNPADPASMNMAAEGTGYDGTSTGIFQQQNNGAWGTLEDRMDPTRSAAMFYDELEKIEGRDNMRLTEVAQRVQGSAHPEAYAKWESKASEELAASKARLESLSKSGGGSGDGQRVFVTNWPSGGSSYARSSSVSSDAIEDAKDAVEDAQKAAFIQDQSIAALAANALGRGDLIQVEKFANGGFHGLENHTAHIAPAGSWRVFGEPETGGEAYIPLASHKRARSTAILAETARRFGYTLGAGVNLVGAALTGNGLDTGWGGPSLSDLGIDTGALRESLSPGVQAEAERAGMQIAAILQELGAAVDQQVEGTLARVDDGTAHLRQQYARAMI